MTGVQRLRVTEDEGEMRLDRWLRRHFPHLSQGQIERMCRKGELRLDGARVRAATRVRPGQEVRVPPLPAPTARPAAEEHRAPARPAEDDRRMMREAVLYMDDHLVAINKPPGLPSQGGSGQGQRHVDALAEALRFGRAEKPLLVHRLDKDTSGVLLLARSPRVARRLSEAFRSRATRKIYWAAVAGVPSPRKGTIRYGLVKGAGSRAEAERMRCLHPDEVDRTPGAKRARTDYAVLSTLGKRAAWVALVPVTGRTHQLRAHMAAMGHPIIGDTKYGTRGQENLGDGWGAQLGGEVSRKLHLHARSIRFRHPITGAEMVITAPLPAHMKRTWDMVGWSVEDVPDDPFDGTEGG
ncbi:MAG: RluA family pseudouridine synthase [Alphaproteobacteria bacterium]|nr:MAG: RluA family pseudouridine synthase [Alphaproteobacteria bacterium]